MLKIIHNLILVRINWKIILWNSHVTVKFKNEKDTI